MELFFIHKPDSKYLALACTGKYPESEWEEGSLDASLQGSTLAPECNPLYLYIGMGTLGHGLNPPMSPATVKRAEGIESCTQIRLA